MIELGILFVGSLVSLIVGVTVFSRSPKSATHLLFLWLTLSLVSWAIANYFLIRSSDESATVMLMIINFFTVVLQNTLFYLFSSIYPKHTWELQKKHLIFIGFSLLVLLLDVTGFVVAGFEDGNLVPGPGIALFTLHAVLAVAGGFRHLYKRKRKRTRESEQINMLIYGSVILWIIVPLTNFVLPNVLDNNFFVRLSALYVLLFNLSISYAILRYKLFDIRAIVARASAYILTLGFFIVAYAGTIAVINTTVFSRSSVSFLQQALYALVAVLSAPLIIVTKRFFDRASSKIFYRDSYDSQALISELNQALVNNVELEGLLTKSALIIQENLKTSFCTFYIRETSYFQPRIIGAHRRQPEFENLEDIEVLAPHSHLRILSASDEYKSEELKKLAKILNQNDIEIMARLVSTLDYEVRGIGYIFLGAKKSGTPYSKQDLKIIEIVANELVIAVENVLRFEEIEQFNVTLQKKIDDATKELKQTNDKLRALDEAKDEFVSMASHQLRTPLTSIKGYISMVLEGDAGKISETQKDMLGQAFFSSQRMVYLISDLLNVSRLKTGKFIIEARPVYLPDLIEDEVNQLHEGAKAKNITLSFTKPKKFPTMNLDDMKIRQVVMNFTDNAIYYTPSGGKIDVSLKETPKSIEFTVRDNGIGVPKEQQPKMFTKFYRADNARKARPDGTGLGLFMAKKVIIAQGGSVIFESKEGQGSTFGFSFPREKLEVEALASKTN